MDGLRYFRDDTYYTQTLACPYVSLRSSMSTGGWDLFLGPLEWARTETGRADRGV